MGGTRKKTNQKDVHIERKGYAKIVTDYGSIQSWLNGTQMRE